MLAQGLLFSRSEPEAWVAPLRAGDASDLVAHLPELDIKTLFRVGMACAERGLLIGVKAIVCYLRMQGREQDVLRMGPRWLEGAILWNKSPTADYLRACGVDPYRAREDEEDFMEDEFVGRRQSRVLHCLTQVEKWKPAFIRQWRHSRLADLSLAYAIANCSSNCVEKLISYGVAVDASCEGEVPLWEAVFVGQSGSVEALIKAGANWRTIGQRQGYTLLTWSAQRGLDECVRVLLKAGMDPLEEDGVGLSALQRAQANERSDIVALIERNLLCRSSGAAGEGTGAHRRL